MKSGEIYLEAILDSHNNCERLDRSRIWRVTRENETMRKIVRNSIVVITYDFWKNEYDKSYDVCTKETIILIDNIDYKKYKKEYESDKKLYKKIHNIRFIETPQYNPYTIYEIQSTNSDMNIYILGDSRLYWKCFETADKLIVIYVDKCIAHKDCISFPIIDKHEWKENMATVFDNITTVVEYKRRCTLECFE